MKVFKCELLQVTNIMNLKHKIIFSLTASFTLAAICMCAYNSTVMYQGVIKDKFNEQNSYANVVTSSIDAFVLNQQQKLTNKYNAIFMNLKTSALTEVLKTNDPSEFLDISALSNFIKSNNSFSSIPVFALDNYKLENKDYLSVLNIPSKNQDLVKASLKSCGIDLAKLWAKKEGGTSLLGYVVEVSSKKYLYVQKVKETDLYNENDSLIYDMNVILADNHDSSKNTNQDIKVSPTKNSADNTEALDNVKKVETSAPVDANVTEENKDTSTDTNDNRNSQSSLTDKEAPKAQLHPVETIKTVKPTTDIVDENSKEFNKKSFEKVISQLNLASNTKNESYAISFVNSDGKILLLNDQDKIFEQVSVFDLEKAKEIVTVEKLGENSTLQIKLGSDKENLVTIKYIPQYDIFVIIESAKSDIVKPIIIENFVIVFFVALLFSIVMCIFYKLNIRFVKEVKSLKTNVDIISTKILASQDSMGETTTALDETTSRFPHFEVLSKSIANLGRSICENVASKTHDLEAKSKLDKETSVKNACLEQVSAIHQHLLPNGDDMPNSKFLDIASFMVTSKTNPSDFYDIFRVDKDNIGVVFGSCNKDGIPAVNAITQIMDFVKKSIICDADLPGKCLTDLNKVLMQRDRDGLQISIFVMILSEFTGNFIYSVAGAKTPLLVHEHNAKFLEPKITQVEMCADIDTVYVDSREKITYLDTLVFTGKGINNVVNTNQDFFGEDKVIELSESNADNSAYDQLIEIYKNSKEFSEGADNSDKDVCAIVVKRNGNNSEFED